MMDVEQQAEKFLEDEFWSDVNNIKRSNDNY